MRSSTRRRLAPLLGRPRRRSCASASAWNVPGRDRPSTPSGASRSTSSPAALRVNVTREHVAGVGCAARAPATRCGGSAPASCPSRPARGSRAAARRDVTASRLARVEVVEETRPAGATVPKGCATRREHERRGKAPSSLRCVCSSELLGADPHRHCDREHALAGAPDTHCRRSLHTRRRSTSGPLCARSVCASFPLSGETPCDVPLDFVLDAHPESDALANRQRRHYDRAPRGQGEIFARHRTS